MKYIFANLKRFDIPVELDGINRLAPAAEWGTYLTEQIQKTMKEFEEEAQFGIFYPEAYLIQAAAAKEPGSRDLPGRHTKRREFRSVHNK